MLWDKGEKTHPSHEGKAALPVPHLSPSLPPRSVPFPFGTNDFSQM